MGQAVEKMTMTPEEFLAWEALQEARYEFVDGDVYCHAGARMSHNLVAGNIFGELRAFLKGSPSKAFSGKPLTLSSIGCSITWNDIFEGATA